MNVSMGQNRILRFYTPEIHVIFYIFSDNAQQKEYKDT